MSLWNKENKTWHTYIPTSTLMTRSWAPGLRTRRMRRRRGAGAALSERRVAVTLQMRRWPQKHSKL